MKTRPILFSTSMVKEEAKSWIHTSKIQLPKNTMETNPRHLMNRLLNGSVYNEKNDCLEWIKHISNKGYGKMTIKKKGKYAHRIMYGLCFGEIKKGNVVLHKCDNPKCINPEHLSSGSQSENMKDCYLKGRSRIQPVSFKGEENPSSKLIKEDVKAIRKLLSCGGINQSAIAKKFNVSQSQISLIKKNKAWKNV